MTRTKLTLFSILMASMMAPTMATKEEADTQETVDVEETENANSLLEKLNKPIFYVGGMIVAAVGISYYQSRGTQESQENNDENQETSLEKYKTWVEGGANDAKGAFTGADLKGNVIANILQKVNKKDAANWREWISEDDKEVQKELTAFLFKEKINVAGKRGNEIPCIIDIEHGFIDSGNYTTLLTGYVTGQLLHILRYVKGEEEAKKIMNHDQGIFLRNLVLRHSRKELKQVVDSHHANCEGPAQALCDLGANPELKPAKGSDDDDPFDSVKTIQEAAKETKNQNKNKYQRLKFEKKNDKWEVTAIEVDTTN